MNMFKKQLKLSSGFGSMTRAVSTSNISDKPPSNFETLTHNLTLDRRSIKVKTPVPNSQDLSEVLNSMYKSLSKNSNENFVKDYLPTSLEDDWLQMKYSSESNVRLQKKNSAMFELLTTELNYLNQMQFLLDVSSKIFSDIQSRYFQYINIEEVFLNLGEIYEVNYHFWTEYLYPSYEKAKRNNDYISCVSWKDGFNQISSMFVPYQMYFSKMAQCQKYIQSLEKDKYFAQFLHWFSRIDQSNRESLKDFIAKPFQRLTKYNLILTTISGYSDSENERHALSEMIHSINSFMDQVELKLSMALISMRIDPIDLVEPPTEDLLDLCTPYRQLHLTHSIKTNEGDIERQVITKGTFKMKEAQNKTFEISLILFTDLMLICQKIKNFETDRIKVIRPIIPLNKLDIINPFDGVLVLRIIDEFGCLAFIYSLISDMSIIHEWTHAIRDTQFSLKGMTTPKQSIDYKLCPILTVNVINPSPLPGQSPTELGTAGSNPLSKHNVGMLYQSTKCECGPLSRSNFRSSPVTRKRITSKCFQKNRAESMCESQTPPFELVAMNRSLSQHSTKSQISILENDNDQDITIEDWSTSTVNIHSPDCPVISESSGDDTYGRKNTYTGGETNIGSKCELMFEMKNAYKVNDMRPYGSMVNLSMNS